MAIDWNLDSIADAILPLQRANELAYAQCFTAPTKEKTAQIKGLLENARDSIDAMLSELAEEE